MGLRFRKSIKVGPFRVNLSKSGIGYSYGVKGYRVTHKANGGVRTTASIPGTGISHVKEYSSAGTSQKREPEKSSAGNVLKVIFLGFFIAVVIVALLVEMAMGIV